MSYTYGYLKQAILTKLDLHESDLSDDNLFGKIPYYINEMMTQICSTIKPKHTHCYFEISKDEVFKSFDMPEDFISFSNEVNLVNDDCSLTRLSTSEYRYLNYNQISFNKPGIYYVAYNALWFTFTSDITNDTIINVPRDILECIPAYVASQYYKADDDAKAAIFRNEFEILFSRIDDSRINNSNTIHIDGGW